MMGLAPLKVEGRTTIPDPYGYVYELIMKDLTRKSRSKPLTEDDAADLAKRTMGELNALR